MTATSGLIQKEALGRCREQPLNITDREFSDDCILPLSPTLRPIRRWTITSMWGKGGATTIGKDKAILGGGWGLWGPCAAIRFGKRTYIGAGSDSPASTDCARRMCTCTLQLSEVQDQVLSDEPYLFKSPLTCWVHWSAFHHHGRILKKFMWLLLNRASDSP